MPQETDSPLAHGPSQETPDTLWEGGTILLNAATGAQTDALLARGGRVVALGEAARQAAPPRRVALAGGVLMPGFIDCHTHLTDAGLAATALTLAGASSAAEVVDLVQAALADHPAGEVLVGEGWDDSAWSLPLVGSALDRLQASSPIVLVRACGHKAVVSDQAMRTLAAARPHLYRTHADPPSGTVVEELAMQCRSIFPATDERLTQACRSAMAEALRVGITCVHDFATPRQARALAASARTGEAVVRVIQCIIEFPDAPETGARVVDDDPTQPLSPTPDWRRGGTKLFLDGSIGARTAALSAPYADLPEDSGRLLWDTEALGRRVAAVAATGQSVALHAIGDRAIEVALDALEPLSDRSPYPHRLEHAELLPNQLLQRLANSKVTASMQPNFVARWGESGGLYERALGAERWTLMNRFGSLAAAGALIAFGSDSMPADPMLGLRGATHHPVASERMTPQAAIAAYTVDAARSLGLGDQLGSLEVGRLADCVLFDRPPWEGGEAEVRATWVGGRCRYAR